MDQTFTDYDLFIAVDGPVNDDVSEYLNNILTKKIEIFRFEFNEGLAATLNKSIKLVKDRGYDFIGRMDADDISLPERFEKQIMYLQENPEIHALGTQAYIIDSNDQVIGVKNAAPHLTMKVLEKSSDIIHPSVVFRATFFDTVKNYALDLIRVEDYDLWFRAIISNLIVKSIPDRLYHFRYDDQLIKRRQDAQKNVIFVKRKYLPKSKYYRLLPHYIIRFSPKFIIKTILKRSIQR